MNCPACGSESLESDKFCRKCGGTLGVPVPDTRPDSTLAPTEQVPPSSVNPWVVTILVFFAALLMGVVALSAVDLMKTTTGGGEPLNPPGTVRNSATATGSTQFATTTGPLLHLYHAGDNWTYAVMMTVIGKDGITHTGSGTLAESIVQGTLNGAQVIADESELSVTFNDNGKLSGITRVFLQQDTSGNYVELGEDNGNGRGEVWASEPQTITPGDWTDAPTTHADLTFNDGSTKHVDMTISPNSTMQSLPNGQQTECWTVDQNLTGSNLNPTEITGSFSPSVGRMIQGTESTPNANIGNVKMTLNLTSYSLVAGGQ